MSIRVRGCDILFAELTHGIAAESIQEAGTEISSADKDADPILGDGLSDCEPRLSWPPQSETINIDPNISVSPSLLSAGFTSDGPKSALRSARIKLVRINRPGRRTARVGIKLIRPKPLPSSDFVLELVNSDLSQDTTESVPDLPLGFVRDFSGTFGNDALERLRSAAKLHSSSGQHLPIQLRDLFLALSDPIVTLGMANALREEHDLAPLKANRGNRIAIRRIIAQTREKLYLELVSALSLPLVPIPEAAEEEDEDIEEKPDLSMTPTNLGILVRTLSKAFPHDKEEIKTFLADNGKNAYGEMEGKVVWQGGVGRMTGGPGAGFREKDATDGSVHVFVDQ